MKSYNKAFTVLGILACISCFISCSKDNDDNLLNKEKDSFITVKVGAPTIETDGRGNTRVALEYDDGLKMTWEASDQIKIIRYKVGSGSESGKKSYNRQQGDQTWTTAAGGTTATFTGTAPDAAEAYVIAYNADYNWKSTNYHQSLTQAGNNNTAHLKNGYRALLLNVSSYNDNGITFSDAWAQAHIPTLPAYTQVEKVDGTIPDNELAHFIQSSCLKVELTLPNTIDVKSINRLLVKATSRIFKKAYGGGSGESNTTTDAIVDFTGISDISTDSYKLTAYIMLGLSDTEIPASEKIQFRVYYGETYNSSNYYVKSITMPSSPKTLSAGKLGTFTLKNTGWKKYPGNTDL